MANLSKRPRFKYIKSICFKLIKWDSFYFKNVYFYKIYKIGY